jgi:methyltransferase-like protein 6
MSSGSVQYFSTDFNFEEHCTSLQDSVLPPITKSVLESATLSISEEGTCSTFFSDNWDSFYARNKSTYQMRRYLVAEFGPYLLHKDCEEEDYSLKIVEVGCGHGSSAFALMQALPEDKVSCYTATDFSAVSIEMLNSHKLTTSVPAEKVNKIDTAIWDITKETILSQKYNICLCVFTLSAIAPQFHRNSIQNISTHIEPNGIVLFRDYAICDMTMYRHKTRLQENLFQRDDNTLCYYFTKEYLHELFTSAGFTVMELDYCCINNVNRKTGQTLKRVFIHSVCKKTM